MESMRAWIGLTELVSLGVGSSADEGVLSVEVEFCSPGGFLAGALLIGAAVGAAMFAAGLVAFALAFGFEFFGVAEMVGKLFADQHFDDGLGRDLGVVELAI